MKNTDALKAVAFQKLLESGLLEQDGEEERKRWIEVVYPGRMISGQPILSQLIKTINTTGGVKVNIEKYHERAGMTQQELAKKMNVSQSAVSLWESKKTVPMRKIWKKLAKVLGCTVDDLLKEER